MTNLIDSVNRDYWSVRDQLASMVRRSEAICDGLDPAGAEVCFTEWPAFITYVAANDEAQIRDFCGACGRRSQWCIDEALERVSFDREVGNEISVLGPDGELTG